MTAGIGHNQGPSLERGHRWRAFQWQRARQRSMPKTIPLMVVKMRVRRAAELGLDYKSYAAIRQATGRDILALLFSSNALRVVKADEPQIPMPEQAALQAVKDAQRLALVHRPVHCDHVTRANPCVDAAERAPLFTDSWTDMRSKLTGFVQQRRLVGDQVLVIGDTSLERDWSTAMRGAGYVAAERYFRRAD